MTDNADGALPCSSSITLGLRHSHSNLPCVSSAHKLAPNASAADIKPPPEVSVVGLVSVTIDVDLKIAHDKPPTPATTRDSPAGLEVPSSGHNKWFDDEMLLETAGFMQEYVRLRVT